MGVKQSLTLREEHRLRVFQNRVLRREFGPKRYEVTGGWRKLHNEERHNLQFSPSTIRMIKSRRMRRAGHVGRMEDKRNACTFLVRKLEEKKPPERPKHGWEDSIKVDLRSIRWDDVAWIYQDQDRDQWRVLVNTETTIRFA
jgi:hypothetical protein